MLIFCIVVLIVSAIILESFSGSLFGMVSSSFLIALVDFFWSVSILGFFVSKQNKNENEENKLSKNLYEIVLMALFTITPIIHSLAFLKNQLSEYFNLNLMQENKLFILWLTLVFSFVVIGVLYFSCVIIIDTIKDNGKVKFKILTIALTLIITAVILYVVSIYWVDKFNLYKYSPDLLNYKYFHHYSIF